MAVHALIMIEFETVYFSITLIPLVGGLIGLIAAIFVGSFSTHKAGRVCDDFAGHRRTGGCLVINLCQFFWRGGGGQRGSHLWSALFWNRILPGCGDLLLSAGWVFVQPCLCTCLLKTPAGRMANAVRTIPSGPSSSDTAPGACALSRFAPRFFAGVAGGLFALNYEFITEENLNAVTSGRVLLMAYIGGLGYFIGPIIGAVVLTLMNSLLSNYTELWMLYLGIMFVLTVLFLPEGFAGSL